MGECFAAPKTGMMWRSYRIVSDVAKARTGMGSDHLKPAMQKSGVIGSPNTRFEG
jgi:hypothetical protein